jgi:hypothetical protein
MIISGFSCFLKVLYFKEKIFIDWFFVINMGGKKKRLEAANNRRLDLFLEGLEIEETKRKKIVEHVEKLTMDALLQKSKPKLRLNK